MKLDIKRHHSLLADNTLALDAHSDFFVEIKHREQIPEAMDYCRELQLPHLLIGGGSNLVLVDDFAGLVMKMALRGITVKESIEEDIEEHFEGGAEGVLVTAQAGENWHQLVQYCLARGINGLENLALIPGTVGAAPVQNIGAYGVELESVFDSLQGWDCELQQWRSLNRSQCQFSYRSSIFKQALKGRFIISQVTFRLHRHQQVNISYRALAEALAQQELSCPQAQDVAATVTAIRQSKLPDPSVLPNVGSFFKNPVVSMAKAAQLREEFPDLVSYPHTEGHQKLAAGWLLEQAGWKGRVMGAVGMHDQQSLVLINYGGATGREVLALSEAIVSDISQRFAIELEIEPQVHQLCK